ncbi:uncharacterized protein LOC103522110, partial [Diaphorina citri]|uniref:Uncharacterized protein LOC103522110 n=1 Tax=Diaphorina citri TaxID=121845 RepID=A0A1S3DNQ7_DIACI
RHDIIKEIAHPFLNNPGDSREIRFIASVSNHLLYFLFQRHDIIKEIAHPFLNNPGDSRVEIVAHTLEEKPEGMFTEEEMKYNFNFMDAPVFGGNRLKREILEFHLSTDKANMDWKFHPNKTCQLVEEIVRKKFDPVIVKCESIKEEVMGRVGPGHEDQYRLLVVSKKFLDQPQLRMKSCDMPYRL